jgi:hypothetical protein
MRLILWRLLLGFAIMLWQGGFTFYALVVVPIGSRHFGVTEQGFVTRDVTVWLNRVGVLAIAIGLGDAIACRRHRRWRTCLLGIVAVLQLVIMYDHHRLDQHLDAASYTVTDSAAFYSLHAIYLIISAIQWLFMLAFAAITLSAWQPTHGDQRTTK